MEQDPFEAKCVLISLWNNCADRTVITLCSHCQSSGFLSNCPMIWSTMLACITLSRTPCGIKCGRYYITRLLRGVDTFSSGLCFKDQMLSAAINVMRTFYQSTFSFAVTRSVNALCILQVVTCHVNRKQHVWSLSGFADMLAIASCWIFFFFFWGLPPAQWTYRWKIHWQRMSSSGQDEYWVYL